MKIEQFNENFAALLNSALTAGVPAHEVLLTLDAARFDIQLKLANYRRQAQINASVKKIIPSTALPPPRSGN